MREEIWDILDDWIESTYGRNKAFNQILSLFKQEIEKMGVISDEKIKKALDNLIASPVVVKKPERAIALAQLQDCKDTLLRMME